MPSLFALFLRLYLRQTRLYLRFPLAAVFTFASITILYTYAPDAIAQSVAYEVSTTSVPVGGMVQVDVVVIAKNQAPIESVSVPDFKDFTIVRQNRSHGTSVQIINGKHSATLEQRISYILQPKNGGVKKIPPVTANIGGQTVRSGPLTINVTGGNGAAAPNNNTGNNTGTTTNPSDQTELAPVPKNGERQPFFLDVQFDKKEVVVGEQATLTVRIFAQGSISDISRPQTPHLPGFLVEDIELPSRITPVQQAVDGQMYYVYVVQKKALFPLEVGKQVIPPIAITIATGGGFMSRGRDLPLSSEAAVLDVKPLPEAGKPAQFSGSNVGTWNVRAEMSGNETQVGQPVTLRLIAQGVGNLKQLRLPELNNLVEGARLFPPTQSEHKFVDGDRIGGEKRFEMLLQPSQEGTLQIPSIALAFYNPTSKKYETAKTAPMTLNVKPNDGSMPVAGNLDPKMSGKNTGKNAGKMGGSVGVQQNINRNLRPVRVNADVREVNTNLFAMPLFWLAIPLPLALALVSLSVRSARDKWKTSTAGRRLSRSRSEDKALIDAVQQKDIAAIERIVFDAVALRVGQDIKAMPTQQLGTVLRQRGADDALVEKILSLVETLQQMRFAPSLMTGTSIEKVGQDASLIVQAIRFMPTMSGVHHVYKMQRIPPASVVFWIGLSLSGTTLLSSSVLAEDTPTTDAPANISDLVAEANGLVAQKEYDAAADAYHRALKIAPHAADLHYSLGVVAMERGRIGEAVLSFKRALWLDPRHEDAAHNLESAVQVRVDQLTALPDALQAVLDAAARIPRSWVLAGWAVPWLLACLVLGLAPWLPAAPQKSLRRALWPLFGLAVAASVPFGLRALADRQLAKEAVILAEETSALPVPQSDASPIFRAHAGLSGIVVDVQAGFVRLRFDNGLEAWIEDSVVANVADLDDIKL